ncbi:PREDICTED: protein SUPPRESSOR OF PHYA-105 1-like [Tarenaya hassleriana]|uniref:protein SUPPRESSOR OF PHYA-105 1-like n=1 Tax=Tarenaya hassleriana TaxID=28532 RepID=UPI00053C9B26|nr:PREDICTED: protein SUPPRESSOR OF PHYA-105 1-like [Tarenaya hassleriana]XP_010523783.1 PREDICTED: protein SUPPRESSOR OF PHYA-105 1-like [Tarenaya hassleriana]XP_010523784.1 PREDICTED: protein SUPPRESSOR OF PHYA-105 1-like [Tarenaya hassleriana]
MEGVGEEIVASNNIQLEGRENNVPCKLDDHIITESQTLNDPLRNDCPASSLHRSVLDASECKDLAKPVVSLNGSGPPLNSDYFVENTTTRASIEELTVGNYRNPGLILGSNTGNSKAEKFDHLYRLANGSGFQTPDEDLDSQPQDMDQMLSKIRQQLARAPSERWNLKPFMSRRSNQFPIAASGRVRVVGDKNVMNASALTSEGTQLKMNSSSSGFSQLILKRAMKGKTKVGKIHESHPDFGGDQDIGSKEERVDIEPPNIRDALNVKSSTKNNTTILYDADEDYPKSSPCGINLREYLRSGCPKRTKVQSLLLFRQLVELVDSAHSQGFFLQHLRPSFFTVYPPDKLEYIGSFDKKDLHADVNEDVSRKRFLVQESSTPARGLKQRKMDARVHSPGSHLQFASTWRSGRRASPEIDLNSIDTWNLDCYEHPYQNRSNHSGMSSLMRKQSLPTALRLEEQWYSCPEELNGDDGRFKSNIYSLGALLFELLCDCESSEIHPAVMSDLCLRILPPRFLSKNPKEAGFCLWLLHPEPSSRPTAREILKSELISHDDCTISTADDDDEVSELLLHFLTSLKEQKQKQESKWLQDIQTLDEDIKEAERRYSSNTSPTKFQGDNDRRLQSYPIDPSCPSQFSTFSVSNANTDRLMGNIRQLEDAYYFMRSQMNLSDSATTARSDKSLLKDRDRCSDIQNENQESRPKGKSSDQRELFFEDLCKLARYGKFETCGTIRSGDLLNSASVICSLSFDRDEEHIAAAGISKRIKIFDVGAFVNDSVTVHYPLVEMCNKSKLSCVCWNSYIKNYLASTDYDGVVQIWDAGTGQGFSQYTEHQRRAWSVDFSPSDPTKFVSGSDDCSVKLWSINEKRSIGTIRSPANVCCVQFSASSNHLLAFGSADYKVYCYDLRHVRTPWCTLAGHEKAVSYVKFMDSDTIVSASTDSSLKMWNLNNTNPSGLSPGACSLTFQGHTNQKNFVGLSVMDGYIACGSETNEVYSYYRSLSMPITSYKFGLVDPLSGNEFHDENGQFVSSVCWRRNSNMLVAANSTGTMKLLKLV